MRKLGWWGGGWGSFRNEVEGKGERMLAVFFWGNGLM
jgi:hypothetical protein